MAQSMPLPPGRVKGKDRGRKELPPPRQAGNVPGMEKTQLGRTGLMVTRTAFGALPVQRVATDAACALLRRAHDAGINFFDTARGYTDSEEKIGLALADVRDGLVIATKTFATDRDGLWRDLETSLRNLRTDRVDILQLHNPRALPDFDDPESSYAGLVQAREQGLTRFAGITSHRLDAALAAVRSGRFDTLQFPLSAISDDGDLQVIDVCRKHDVGLIAMKALCGGLLANAPAAFAFLRQFDNVVPIWGIQRERELDEFLSLDADPPPLTDELRAVIAAERKALAGDFCRACGYCLPCPAEIRSPWPRA